MSNIGRKIEQNKEIVQWQVPSWSFPETNCPCCFVLVPKRMNLHKYNICLAQLELWRWQHKEMCATNLLRCRWASQNCEVVAWAKCPRNVEFVFCKLISRQTEEGKVAWIMVIAKLCRTSKVRLKTHRQLRCCTWHFAHKGKWKKVRVQWWQMFSVTCESIFFLGCHKSQSPTSTKRKLEFCEEWSCCSPWNRFKPLLFLQWCAAKDLTEIVNRTSSGPCVARLVLGMLSTSMCVQNWTSRFLCVRQRSARNGALRASTFLIVLADTFVDTLCSRVCAQWREQKFTRFRNGSQHRTHLSFIVTKTETPLFQHDVYFLLFFTGKEKENVMLEVRSRTLLSPSLKMCSQRSLGGPGMSRPTVITSCPTAPFHTRIASNIGGHGDMQVQDPTLNKMDNSYISCTFNSIAGAPTRTCCSHPFSNHDPLVWAKIVSHTLPGSRSLSRTRSVWTTTSWVQRRCWHQHHQAAVSCPFIDGARLSPELPSASSSRLQSVPRAGNNSKQESALSQLRVSPPRTASGSTSESRETNDVGTKILLGKNRKPTNIYKTKLFCSDSSADRWKVIQSQFCWLREWGLWSCRSCCPKPGLLSWWQRLPEYQQSGGIKMCTFLRKCTGWWVKLWTKLWCLHALFEDAWFGRGLQSGVCFSAEVMFSHDAGVWRPLQKAGDQTYGENGGLGDVEHAPDGDSEWIQLLLLQETHHLENVQQIQCVWLARTSTRRTKRNLGWWPGFKRGKLRFWRVSAFWIVTTPQQASWKTLTCSFQQLPINRCGLWFIQATSNKPTHLKPKIHWSLSPLYNVTHSVSQGFSLKISTWKLLGLEIPFAKSLANFILIRWFRTEFETQTQGVDELPVSKGSSKASQTGRNSPHSARRILPTFQLETHISPSREPGKNLLPNHSHIWTERRQNQRRKGH